MGISREEEEAAVAAEEMIVGKNYIELAKLVFSTLYVDIHDIFRINNVIRLRQFNYLTGKETAFAQKLNVSLFFSSFAAIV